MLVHISLVTCDVGAVSLRGFALVDSFGRAQSELMSVASTGFDLSRRNGFLYPVLKHGPRSLTHVRVQGWQTPVRNESDSGWTRGSSGAQSAGQNPSGARSECEHMC